MATAGPTTVTLTAATTRPPAPALNAAVHPDPSPTPMPSGINSVITSSGAGPDDVSTCSCATGATDRLTRLVAAAGEAAQVRSLTTRPDVVALRVDRIRAQVDALLWAGIGLGLLFTTVNVQAFAAAGAAAFTTAWWVAWLLDPMVSLVLLAVLRAEQVTARYEVALGAWPRGAKWCAFAATYLMNTWHSWGLDGAPPSVSGIVLHSVPPLLVLLSAETGPVLRERLTEAARRASTDHPRPGTSVGRTVHDADVPGERAVHESPANDVLASLDDVHEPTSCTGHERGGDRDDALVRERTTRERGTRQHQVSGPPESATGGTSSTRRSARATAPRRLLADYLTEARSALDRAAATGQHPDPTPAWCRRTTGCSRGTSVKLAAALRASGDPRSADP